MATPEKQLAGFLVKYSPEMVSEAEWVLARLRRRFPTAAELVYDNYNALAIGWSPSDRASEVVVSIAIYPKWINLFFMQSEGLDDPDGWLGETVKLIRHIKLQPVGVLEDPGVQDLLDQAMEMAKVPFDPKGKYRLVVKSVSEKQRPRRPAEKVRK